VEFLGLGARSLVVTLLLQGIGGAATAEYTIALHDRALQVRARFPVAAQESVAFELHSWAGYDFYGDVDGVAAADLRGNVLAVESKGNGQWLVPNHRQPFELRWRVKAPKDSMMGNVPGGQFHASLFADWAVMWGHAFILAPVSGPLASGPVAVQVEANEYGKWDSTLPAGGVLPHLRDLPDQLFLAGAFRNVRQADRQYYFATSQAVVPDRDLMNAVDKIFSAQTRYMGAKPSRPPMLVFTDGRSGSSGGTVVQNSAVYYPDLTRDLSAGNQAALRLIGHELCHLWNGQPDGPQGGCSVVRRPVRLVHGGLHRILQRRDAVSRRAVGWSGIR
jgi:hypothetical protein